MVSRTRRSSDDSIDPLSRALAPPARESAAQRAAREAKEAEGRRVSDLIDEQIKLEKHANSRKKTPVKVLMLGQAESGKTTTVKIFQMSYARQAWEEERMSWRTVIHLNLVRSVNRILDALENAQEIASRMNLLRIRLSPLRRVQVDLERHLGLAVGDEVCAAADMGVFRRPAEVCLRSQSGWAAALGLAKQKTRIPSGRSLADGALEVILNFLEDLYRIAHRDYEPTDEDVVRARLRTVGVQEYRFVIESGREAGREWIFYDVGGSRTHRGAWHPYFMDVKAIIFLAPISVFDEKLEGDARTNRLEDSIKFWTTVCKSKLLVRVQLILFLNKCDILERKLARGVSLERYIPTFGDRKNDMPTASKYLRRQFLEIARKHSPEPRRVYSFMTTAINTRAMTSILGAVREGILNDNLRSMELVS
ncbi:guanine nucleotide binding protein, alpha subunit [Russula earlei]|uniref:Guanine nucleotide binding protein, alpha subunit n=1 Tax=Russula earlei TaxID=71964 RepID=A0ACC0UEA5_9AGAM|nr:guanine nucleotide binding protein, alpha subunit [Russula earlei]